MPMPEARRVPGHRTVRFPAVDPATGETFDEVPDQQPDELDDVVARARRAWRG